MKENRSSKRYDVDIEVEIAGRAGARTRNISIGGMLLVTEAKLAAGDVIQLVFRVPGLKEPVETAAIVRWSDAAGTGVQFDGLRARDVWALGKYFEQL